MRKKHRVQVKIEFEREDDGRWLAEIPDVPGVMAYATTPEGAAQEALALFIDVIAEHLAHGEGDRTGFPPEMLPEMMLAFAAAVRSGRMHLKLPAAPSSARSKHRSHTSWSPRRVSALEFATA